MLERHNVSECKLLTGEWAGTDFTFSTIVLFQHLNIWVVGQAVFAAGREICGFPARTVEILFDLWWRHDGSYSLSSRDTPRVQCDLRDRGRTKVSYMQALV